jgi:hypothetical protein
LEDPGPAEEEEAERPVPGAGLARDEAEPAAREDPEPAARGEAEPAAAEPVAASVAIADLDFAELTRVWPSVLDELAKTAPALAATFEGARPVGIGESGPEIGFPPDRTFNKRKAEEPERRVAVAAAFGAVLGRELKPTYVLLEEDEGEAPPDVPAPGSGELDEEAILEKVKSEFGAEEVG